jgi:hypothetical protein
VDFVWHGIIHGCSAFIMVSRAIGRSARVCQQLFYNMGSLRLAVNLRSGH